MKPIYRAAIGPRSQQGFSLLEVMIALLVLSIGLLGLAALQTFSLKFNHQSYQRTQATLLIYDMIDRMRANPQGVFAGDYALGMTNSPPSSKNCDKGDDCSSTTDMAAYDQRRWLESVTAQLNAGEGEIRVTSPSIFTITVRWSENDLTLSQSIDVQVMPI